MNGLWSKFSLPNERMGNKKDLNQIVNNAILFWNCTAISSVCSLLSLMSVWSSMSKITKIFSLFLCLHSMDTGIELCQSNFDMISRLKRDTPSVIQRNSWPMFFQSCSISQLVFAYPLVKQNGRLMLLLSSWLQNYHLIHHQLMKAKITKPTCQ